MKNPISFVVVSFGVLFISANVAGCGPLVDPKIYASGQIDVGDINVPPDLFMPPQPAPSPPPSWDDWDESSDDDEDKTDPVDPVWTPALKVEVVDTRTPFEHELVRTVGDDNIDALVLALKFTAQRDNVSLSSLMVAMSHLPNAVRLTNSNWDNLATGSLASNGTISFTPLASVIAVLAKKGDSITIYVRAHLKGLGGRSVRTYGLWADYETTDGFDSMTMFGLSNLVNVVETPRAAIAAVSSLVRIHDDKVGEVLAAEVDIVNNSTKHALDLTSLDASLNSGADIEMRLEDTLNTVLSHAERSSWVQYGRCHRHFRVTDGLCRLQPGERKRLRIYLDPTNLVANEVDIQIRGAFVTSINGQQAWVQGIYNYAVWDYEKHVNRFQSNIGGPVEAFSIAQVSTGSVASVGSVVVARVEITPANAAAVHTLDSFQVSTITGDNSLPRNFRVLVNGIPQASFTLTTWDQPATITLTSVDLMPGQTTVIEIEAEVLQSEAGKYLQLMLWDFQSDSFEDTANYVADFVLLG